MASIDKNINISKEEAEEDEEGEGRIPVLTVFKNSAIIKNIFIVPNKNNNHVLVGGRHPDCNIVLTHPSISRFHLEIRFNPSSHTLSLVDLSSVHGTWVNGRKLEPEESVEIKEGDTFTLGISTRLYRLSWVPFVSKFGVVFPLLDQQEVELVKNLRPDENLELSVEQEIPVCCDEERRNDQSEDENCGVLNGTERSYLGSNSDSEDSLCGHQKHALSPPYMQSVEEFENKEKHEALPELEMPEETNMLCTLREYLKQNICLPVVEAVQGTTKMEQFEGAFHTQLPSVEKYWLSLLANIDLASLDEEGAAAVAVMPKESEFGCTLKDSDKVGDILTTGARTFSFENSSSVVGKDIPDSKFPQIKLVEGASVDSPPSHGETQDRCCKEYKSKLDDPNAKSCHEQGSSLDEISEDIGNKCIENMMDPTFSAEEGVAAVTVIPKEYELGCTLGDNERVEDILTPEARTSNFESTSLLTEEANPVTGFQLIKIVEEVVVDSVPDGEKQNECGKELNANSCDEGSLDEIAEDNGKSFRVESPNSPILQEANLEITNKKENLSPLLPEEEILESHVEAIEKAISSQEQGLSPDELVKDIRKTCTGSISPSSLQVESVNYSVPQESVLNITKNIENQTVQSLISETGCSEMEISKRSVEEVTKKSSTFGNIWSRNGKAASAPQVRTRKSKFMSNVDTNVKMDIKTKSIAKDLFFVLDEEEIFTPNKENSGLDTKSQRSQAMKANFSPNIYPAESISSTSNKKNPTQRKSRRKLLEGHINLAHEQDNMALKKNIVERIPFQSLTNSGGNSKLRTSRPVSAAKSIKDASNCGQVSEKCTKPSHFNEKRNRSWDMVVDTASLLNKDSRKALQLLQGLKGTRLIVPRSVIMELGSMKQQFRFFRRTSAASLALKWIEECMENTKSWIHIQSSMEECKLSAPSLLASLLQKTQFFPGPKSSMVEDHILDFALLYKRKEKNAGQLVLLSDDVTLKIKSMEKGLLCETVEEFRKSLANPFSERFMWPKSSPRGLTWSCQDDEILREKYCGLPSRAGLKLIATQQIR